MTYLRFLSCNVIGGVMWVTVCIFAGYFFGNISYVRKNFTVVILGIIFVSVLPTIIEYIRQRYFAKKPRAEK